VNEDPAGHAGHDLTELQPAELQPATEDRVNELELDGDPGPEPDLEADWPPIPDWRRDGEWWIGSIGDEEVARIWVGAPAPTPLTERFPDPVRGVLAEKVVLVTTLDPYLSLDELEKYSGFKLRTLRSFLKGQNVLPHYRIGYGKILVRVSDWDAFIAPHRHTKGRMEEIVDERRRLRAGRRRPRGR
jgi:hypothetical protein